MNVHTKTWARPLALFIALTMIMMYSFGGVAFASINDVRVHYHGSSDTGYLVVTTTVSGVAYTAIVGPKQGNHYDGSFDPDLPLEKGDKLNENGVVTSVSTTIGSFYTTFGIDHSSAIGKKSANIFVGEAINQRNYDLELSKSVNPTNVNVGETVTFTIQVTNNGNVNANTLSVTDTWPDGLSISGVTAADGTSFSGSTWNIGDLAFGDSVSLQLVAVATTSGSFTNTAVLNVTDDTPNNNQDDATVIVTDPQNPIKNLQVQKSVNNKIVTIGGIVIFTIEAKNIGDTAMDGVLVTDNLPTGLSVSAVDFSSGTTFGGITWEVGSLNAGESKYLTIAAVTTTTGSITNTASGTAIGDTTPGNNSDSETVQVNPKTQTPDPVKDLEITKTVNQASQASVTVGTGVTFTITVTNIGDTTMEAIEVKETWDTGLTQGTVNAAEGTTFSGTTWEVGTLGPDESKTLTIAAGTPTAGTYTNKVAIDFGEGADDNLNNNTAAAIVTVTNPVTPPPGGGGGGGTSGGGGVGGTSTTITPTPPPLAEIPETETPMVEAPEVIMEEQPIPLADVPQTGDNTNIWLLLALMMGSGAGIVLLGRRKETVEK